MSSWSISTKVWDRPGIELATHNYFIHVTLRFQIRATYAYWSSNVSRLTQTPPPPNKSTPHTHHHHHHHDIGATHIDIELSLINPVGRLIAWNRFTINRCVCKHNVTTRIFLKTTTVCAMIKKIFFLTSKGIDMGPDWVHLMFWRLLTGRHIFWPTVNHFIVFLHLISPNVRKARFRCVTTGYWSRNGYRNFFLIFKRSIFQFSDMSEKVIHASHDLLT